MSDHRMGQALLRRVTIELRPDGRWDLTREMAETGDRFVCDDLLDATDIVMRAFRPDGTPRWDGTAAGLCSERTSETGTEQETKR